MTRNCVCVGDGVLTTGPAAGCLPCCSVLAT